MTALGAIRVLPPVAAAPDSWLAHLPVRWIVLVASIDVLLTLVLIVRRQRSHRAISINR